MNEDSLTFNILKKTSKIIVAFIHVSHVILFAKRKDKKHNWAFNNMNISRSNCFVAHCWERFYYILLVVLFKLVFLAVGCII